MSEVKMSTRKANEVIFKSYQDVITKMKLEKMRKLTKVRLDFKN